MTDVLREFLRWLFWGTLYLATFLTALLLVMPLPMPLFMRLSIVGVFAVGIAVDVERKRREGPPRRHGGPGGGRMIPTSGRIKA